MRGRKPVPTALKTLRGNPGKRVLPTDIAAPGALFEPPEFLTARQRETWAYAIENAPAGLLRRLDRSVMTVWVVAADLHRQAAEEIATTGLVVRGQGKAAPPYQSPFIGILNRQAQVMLKAAAELGFTPSSRSRVALSPDEKPEIAFAVFER